MALNTHVADTELIELLIPTKALSLAATSSQAMQGSGGASGTGETKVASSQQNPFADTWEASSFTDGDAQAVQQKVVDATMKINQVMSPIQVTSW